MTIKPAAFYRTITQVLASIIAASTPLMAVAGGKAEAASEWGTAALVPGVNSTVADGCPIESADGLSLFIASPRPGGVGGNDIWAADRTSIDAPWQTPRNLGEPTNTTFNDFCPTPAFGRYLFQVSERLDSGTDEPVCGGGDMYLSRQSPVGDWSKPSMLRCAPEGPNTPGAERSPAPVQTWLGTFLFYSSNAAGTQDIYVSRMERDGQFGPGKLVPELSTEYQDIMPNVRVRDDGLLEIVFSSDRPTWGNGQKAMGLQDVYIAYAWIPTGRWSAPRNLGKAVNTELAEQRSTLSNDGRRLYFGRDNDIYMSPRRGNH
jgi:hypothetical protein